MKEKKLHIQDIIKELDILATYGDLQKSIFDIVFDSRKIKENSLFFAIQGTQSDGHQYIKQCINKGAIAIVCEKLPSEIDKNITYIHVKDSNIALGKVASLFFNQPSKKLKLIGVTGTNGKTTIATLLYQLFKKLGYKTGLLSTVENYIDNRVINATHTTPDAIQINKLMNEMVEMGCDYCFMEVSSHAIVQNRIAALDFDAGIFTNITHDHLDYHKTFKEYIRAKKLFFDNLKKEAFTIVNKDDKNGMVMLQNTAAKKYSYSMLEIADYKSKVLEKHFDGTLIKLNQTELWSQLIGDFNVYNLTAIIATAIELGMDKEQVFAQASTLQAVNGRFETIKGEKGNIAIVDYAHTPDALLNILNTINKLKEDNQNIITVVGAGGNRDKSKRPEMAQIAAKNSTQLILTSDNPRNENPEKILDDMEEGLDIIDKKKMLRISNRKEAIKTACRLATKNDIILVAGKGHETYQEINGIKHHFDDKEILRENL